MHTIILEEPAVSIITPTLMMETAGSSEMMVYQTTQHPIPQDSCLVGNMLTNFLTDLRIRIFHLFKGILLTTFKQQCTEFYKLMHQFLQFIIRYSSMYNNNLYTDSLNS